MDQDTSVATEAPQKVFVALIRHGERADFAEEKIDYEIESDPPLTDKGLV